LVFVYLAVSMSATVSTIVDAGVATVTVDNPPVNALGDETLAELAQAAERLDGDSAVRAIVVTGAGERTFISGADLREFERMLGDRAAMEAHVALTGRVFGAWAALAQPVVAAVSGYALGGGLEFALVCDFIVADPRARLGVPEVGLGLIPGAGGTQRLPQRVGLGAARRMLLTGELLRAPEAKDVGLVDFVAAGGAALSEAQALATRLAALPAGAVRAAKTALRAAAAEDLTHGLAVERRLFLGVAASADAQEGAAAFLAKRPPQFIHS
jgi:enoyl-CoA hydratase